MATGRSWSAVVKVLDRRWSKSWTAGDPRPQIREGCEGVHSRKTISFSSASGHDAAREGARAGIRVESAETPEADADRLIASFRLRAYSQARLRQRQARAAEAVAHWGAVASLIARRVSERRGADPSTRKELDADSRAGPRASARPRPSAFLRLTHWTNSSEFSLLTRSASGSNSLASAPILDRPSHRNRNSAPDASGAIRAAAEAAWPPRAVGLRVLDLDGREIFERLKADRR